MICLKKENTFILRTYGNSKLMTLKEGIEITKRGKIYRHGDMIPGMVLRSIDSKYLEELKLESLV